MSLRVPTLETERLTIRPFVMDDLAACHQMLDLDLAFEDLSLEARTRWLQWTIMNYEELVQLRQPPYGDRAVILKQAGLLIGACGFVPCLAPFGQLPSFGGIHPSGPASLYTAEVGLFYAFSPSHWGNGYATEAARALITFAFTTLHLKRIVATTAHTNTRSIGVMTRVGMGIERNLSADPPWFQVVGILENDA
jgi:ribosomal-protein-alanine N-acetyltransferase